MTKHELQHDEMQDFGVKLIVWYHKHSNLLTTILLVVVVAFAGWRLYGYYLNNRAARISAELGTALQNFNEAWMETDEAKRKELLTTAITETEKITRDYKGAYTGRAAQLLLGNMHYYNAMLKLDNADESMAAFKNAREAYERYIALEGNTPAEKAAGQVALGYALESTSFKTRDPKLVAEADRAYNEAVKLAPNTYIAAEAKLALARLLQNQTGRQEEAQKNYEAVAFERKLPLAAPDPKEKPFKDIQGNEISIGEINKLRNFYDLSYAADAERSINILKGLPTSRISEK
ncbi:MAG: hypothetical protein WCK47_00935 [bacterium]|nr:tetratricopeptide repeat protein [Candidatus Sumerlaeota bacterium]